MANSAVSGGEVAAQRSSQRQPKEGVVDIRGNRLMQRPSRTSVNKAAWRRTAGVAAMLFAALAAVTPAAYASGGPASPIATNASASQIATPVAPTDPLPKSTPKTVLRDLGVPTDTGATYVFLIDTSESMTDAALSGVGSRADAAKSLVKSVLASLSPHDFVVIIGFDEHVQFPSYERFMTGGVNAVMPYYPLQPPPSYYGPKAGTDIGAALASAYSALAARQKQTGPASVVLLTDGGENVAATAKYAPKHTAAWTHLQENFKALKSLYPSVTGYVVPLPGDESGLKEMRRAIPSARPITSVQPEQLRAALSQDVDAVAWAAAQRKLAVDNGRGVDASYVVGKSKGKSVVTVRLTNDMTYAPAQVTGLQLTVGGQQVKSSLPSTVNLPAGTHSDTVVTVPTRPGPFTITVTGQVSSPWSATVLPPAHLSVASGIGHGSYEDLNPGKSPGSGSVGHKLLWAVVALVALAVAAFIFLVARRRRKAAERDAAAERLEAAERDAAAERLEAEKRGAAAERLEAERRDAEAELVPVGDLVVFGPPKDEFDAAPSRHLLCLRRADDASLSASGTVTAGTVTSGLAALPANYQLLAARSLRLSDSHGNLVRSWEFEFPTAGPRAKNVTVFVSLAPGRPVAAGQKVDRIAVRVGDAEVTCVLNVVVGDAFGSTGPRVCIGGIVNGVTVAYVDEFTVLEPLSAGVD